MFLAKMFPIELYLIDFSDLALAAARENARRLEVENVKLVRGDILHMPFPDNEFDVVYSGGVNEHFEGAWRRQSFAEMLRICKPEGVVLVHVPNALCIPYRLGKFILELTGLWKWGLEIPYSRTEIAQLSRILGGTWRIEASGDSSFLGSFMWLPPLIFLRPNKLGAWLLANLRLFDCLTLRIIYQNGYL